MPPVHMAILRRVRPGHEADFEAALLDFLGSTMHVDGVLGVHLIRSAPHQAEREFGILRSFRDPASRDRFYASPEFAAWEARIAPWVDGPPRRREIHGLEAFFRHPHAEPPRWKMFLLTYLGVLPTAVFWSRVIPPQFPGREWTIAIVLNLAIVATLTWLVMPVITRLFSAWITPDFTREGPQP